MNYKMWRICREVVVGCFMAVCRRLCRGTDVGDTC